jgi:hypothetical protein
VITPTGRDAFFARYDALGALSWVRKAGGAGSHVGESASALPDGSCLFAGMFYGSATFGAGEPTQTTFTSASPAGVDVFVARYTADGGLAWARRAGGIGTDIAAGVGAFPDESLVVVGSFEDAATFGPGDPLETTLTAAGATDAFIARFNADGGF